MTPERVPDLKEFNIYLRKLIELLTDDPDVDDWWENYYESEYFSYPLYSGEETIIFVEFIFDCEKRFRN